jgi:cell division initiation protein
VEALPQLIRDAAFRERLRGYNPDDVDEFLERVALGVELLEERLAQAVARADRAEREVAVRGPGDGAVERTLRLAERTAELAVREARDEAAGLVTAAQEEARGLVAEAEAQARRLADEAQRELRADVSRLQVTRAHLGQDVAALEHFLAEQRGLAQRVLNEAALRLGELVPAPAPPPELHDGALAPADETASPAPSTPAEASADEDDPFAEVRRSALGGAPADAASHAG